MRDAHAWQHQDTLLGCIFICAVLPCPSRRLTSLKALVAALLPLRQLSQLHLGFCEGLASIKPLGRLDALRDLHLEGITRPAAAHGVGALTHLTRLVLKGLGQGTDSLHFLGSLRALCELQLEWESCPIERRMEVQLYGRRIYMSDHIYSKSVLDSLPPLPRLQRLELGSAGVCRIQVCCPEGGGRGHPAFCCPRMLTNHTSSPISSGLLVWPFTFTL
jgi:hypothetical protein